MVSGDRSVGGIVRKRKLRAPFSYTLSCNAVSTYLQVDVGLVVLRAYHQLCIELQDLVLDVTFV
jgi:hypothetical protein